MSERDENLHDDFDESERTCQRCATTWWPADAADCPTCVIARVIASDARATDPQPDTRPELAGIHVSPALIENAARSYFAGGVR